MNKTRWPLWIVVVIGLITLRQSVAMFNAAVHHPYYHHQRVAFNRFAFTLWKLGRSVNSFALDLFRNMDHQSHRSILVSPFPVDYNLAAVSLSAEAQTLDELKYVMHLYGFRTDEVHWAFPKMCHLLQNHISPFMTMQGINYNFTMARRIYTGRSANLYDNYQSHIQRTYNLSAPSLEFGRPEDAAKEINEWIEQQTNGKIREFIPDPQKLNPNTSLLLISAAAFEGQFKETDADKEGDRVTLKGEYDYTEDDYLMSRAVKIPLKGGETVLVIVEPKLATDLGFLIDRLTGDYLAIMLKRSMRPTMVKLQIPEIDLNSQTYNLRDSLGRDGIIHLFQPHLAMLGGIGRNRNMHVSDILHKSSISIKLGKKKNKKKPEPEKQSKMSSFLVSNPLFYESREGEGAANTAMPLDGAFLFFVIDARTEMILHLGKYVPDGAEGLDINTISVTKPHTEANPMVIVHGTTLNIDLTGVSLSPAVDNTPETNDYTTTAQHEETTNTTTVETTEASTETITTTSAETTTISVPAVTATTTISSTTDSTSISTPTTTSSSAPMTTTMSSSTPMTTLTSISTPITTSSSTQITTTTSSSTPMTTTPSSTPMTTTTPSSTTITTEASSTSAEVILSSSSSLAPSNISTGIGTAQLNFKAPDVIEAPTEQPSVATPTTEANDGPVMLNDIVKQASLYVEEQTGKQMKKSRIPHPKRFNGKGVGQFKIYRL